MLSVKKKLLKKERKYVKIQNRTFEMLAESQRDLTAEQAAQRLRDVSDVHYKEC